MFTGPVPAAELPAHHAAGDVFALPCRTRGGGLDVEGLGIVLLEASAAGCRWSRATPAAPPRPSAKGVTGHVVDGRDTAALADALAGLLADPDRARGDGRGRPGVDAARLGVARAGAAAARPARRRAAAAPGVRVRDRACAVRPAG